MTDKQLGRLTLDDIERLAVRIAKAARDIREGQALLAPGTGYVMPAPQSEPGASGLIIPATEMPTEEDPIAEHRRRQFQPPDDRRPAGLQTDPRARLTAADRALKESLLRRNARAPVDPNLPPDIVAAETTHES